MALSDQFPDLYAAWVAAGGPEDNFHAHVCAVNPPGFVIAAEDLAFMVAHTNGAFTQLSLATTNLNKTTPVLVQKAVLVSQATA